MIKLNHLDYYRLPWNLTDNIISWLEPTAKCNLACFGCYRKNEVNSHKSFEQVIEEILLFKRMRNTDAMSIAGGDPLLHPDIVRIVQFIKAQKIKPIINTNGIALTKELLKELKKAGIYGFTFHVDSKQNRPGWKDSNEIELNELRYHYASMLASEKNISCSFNSTVYRDTMQYIPGMVEWANKNIDIVNVMVFILYRAVTNDFVDFYLGPEKIDMSNLVYNSEESKVVDIKTEELYEIFKKNDPNYDACSYLNGSENPESFKWFLAGRLGTKKKIFGYLGPKTMEIVQTFNHLLFGKYLSYTSPKISRKGKSLLLLSPFDKKLRQAVKNFFINPFNMFRRLYYQSIMVIQPVDLTDDGRQSMCDGCPDITLWNGKFVWSCRLEEQLNYGINLRTFPKEGIKLNKKSVVS
ncbi:MAG: 7-carboxy-7-deazaguanine synthase [Ignavibacteria bacterium]|nr:7-carboxy-7-deazaguanine synthase [Ignavibacteria bacterium]